MKMGLMNKTTTSFETEDGVAGAAADAAVVADNAAAAVTGGGAAATGEAKVETGAQPGQTTGATGSAVAAKTNTAVAVKSKIDLRFMDSFKDALKVEYNTLAQMTAQQGSFIDRESKKVLGDTIVFELLSYQDSWVVSPEDDNAPDELVKYSNDGINCSDGSMTCADHIHFLKENGYPKARLKERVVVVGAVQSSAKTEEFNGTLVQFDLSPASRTQWQRFLVNAAYGISVQKYSTEQVCRVKATTELAQGGGNNTFTLVKFAVAA